MIQFGLHQISIVFLIVNFHLFWILVAAIVFPIAYDISRAKGDGESKNNDDFEILKPSTKWDNLQPIKKKQFLNLSVSSSKRIPPRPLPQMGKNGKMIL